MKKQKTNEGIAELADAADRDHEHQMARADLYKIAKYGIKLHDMLRDADVELEEWQRAKITKASDYLSSVYHSLDYQLHTDEVEPEPAVKMEKAYRPVDMKDEYKATLHSRLQEKAVSKSQQQAAGIALKHKREGTKPKKGTASAEMMDMSISDLEDFASTKHKGLKDKKGKKK